jgi:phytoene synthase
MSSLSARREVSDAYRHCWRIATAHHENFTIGSWLLPRSLRRHIAAIYAFARIADDFADEGSLGVEERLARLDSWEEQLRAAYQGRATHPIFLALGETVRQFDIPRQPFCRLLDAFRQDVRFRPFARFADLLAYCERSANPVGHLILYLFGYRDVERQALANQICSGLQLANFWQDLAVDVARGRIYVPAEDLERFGCAAADLRSGVMSPQLRQLLAFEVERARELLRGGLVLAEQVDRQLAREVRLFAWGGLAILQAIEAAEHDVFARRPTVSSTAKAVLVLRAFWVAAGVRLLPDPAPLPEAATGEGSRPVANSGNGGRDGDGGRSAQPPVKTMRSLDDAYAYCQDLTRRSSSNFAYAFRLLGLERRRALHAVYAFCRFVDDIADERGRRDPAQLLLRWREELERAYEGTPEHPIGCALADAARRFALPRQHFLDLMRGVEMDLERTRYADFDGLHEYCYLVASTVGLLCIEIFGYREASARSYAIDLGIAFQLTNILRDVNEDAQRGRIYVPLEDLRRFDCTEDELLRGRYSPRLGALMAFECGRARAYYLRARGALAPADRGSLAAAEAMRLIYERLLDRIESRHFDVFGARVTLPRYQKLTLAVAAWSRSQLPLLGW